MHYRFLAIARTGRLILAPLAHAEDAVVPDEFEREQTIGACDSYGAGFAKLPGTGTCVRVSGHVRFENRHSNQSSGFSGQSTLDVETRND